MNIFYRKGFKYQLMETVAVQTEVRPAEDIITSFYEIHSTGLVVGKAGYAWDGPSGPTFDTKTFMRGSLIHDIVYQAMREGLLPWGDGNKDAADLELYRICREDGMHRFRAHYVLKAVQKCGGKEGVNPYRIYSAPDKKALPPC